LRGANKIIATFFLIVIVSFVSLGQLFQTKLFSNFISKKINSLLGESQSMNFGFEKIGLSYFPPGIDFYNASVETSIDGIGRISGEFELVEVGFGIQDMLASKISAGSITMHGGSLKLDVISLLEKNSTELKSQVKINEQVDNVLQKVTKDYSSWRKSRVRALSFQGVEFIFSKRNDAFVAKSLQIEIGRFFTNVKGLVYNKQQIGSKIDLLNMLQVVDEFNFDISIDRKAVDIKKFNIVSRSSAIGVSGSLLVHPDGGADSKIVVNVIGGVGELCEHINKFDNINEIGFKNIKHVCSNIDDGHLSFDIGVAGPLDALVATVYIKGKKITSTVAKFDDFEMKAIIKDGAASLEGAVFKIDAGTVKILRPVQVYSRESGIVKSLALALSLETVTFANMFYDPQNQLDIIKGNISGEVDFVYNDQEKFFFIKSGAVVRDFKLLDYKTKGVILENSMITFNSAKLQLLSEGNKLVDLNVDFSFKNSRVVATGIISSDRIDITSKENMIDLEKFGAISGTMLFGVGEVPFSVRGPYDDVVLTFNPKVSNFSLLGLGLGTINGSVSYGLKNSKLEFDVLGSFQQTEYDSSGHVDLNNELLSIEANIKKTSWEDSRKMFAALLPPEYEAMYSKFSLDYATRFKVIGPIDESKMTIHGLLKGRRLKAFHEGAEYVETKFNYRDNVIKLTDIVAMKRNGKLQGNALYDANKKYVEYDVTLNGGHLRDLESYATLKLGYDGQVTGAFHGNGNILDFTSRMDLKVTSGEINGTSVGDSLLTVYSDSSDYFIKGDLVGGIIELDANINLKEPTEKSYVKLNVESNNMNVIGGLLSDHNMINPLVRGVLKGSLESHFTVDRWRQLDLHVRVNAFEFSNGNYHLAIDSGKNYLNVKNGIIDTWDIRVSGDAGAEVVSLGLGALEKDFSVTTEGNLDASLLELITPTIKQGVGKIGFRNLIKGRVDKVVQHLDVLGRDVILQVAGLPGVIENSDFAFSVVNDELFIKYASATYGKGRLTVDGGAKFSVPFPAVDLKMVADDCKLLIGKDSSFVMSMNLNMRGDTVPYKITGDVTVEYGQIKDSLDELFRNEIKNVEVGRFAPKREGRSSGIDRFVADVEVRIQDTISIKNGFASVFLGGGVVVRGSMETPLLAGEITVAPGNSKFFFKGHEFNIKEGTIVFDDNRVKRFPSVSFSGVAKIDRYDVTVKVVGRVDDATVLLSSEPLLPKEDILSLLAIGVTSDMTKELHDDDIKSVTSLGIGSLLVDQLKLNQKLNEKLGVKVSVLPEYAEDDSSMLESQKTGKAQMRLKSATKIKLKKAISRKIDVSVSSVVGGTMREKQEMNVDLKISDKVKLQGVYEIKSEDEMDRESTSSVGADFKFGFDF